MSTRYQSKNLILIEKILLYLNFCHIVLQFDEGRWCGSYWRCFFFFFFQLNLMFSI